MDAIVSLLKDEPAGTADDNGTVDALRYQGSNDTNQGSALHIAINAGHVEVVWLLLAFASNLDWAAFPQAVLDGLTTFNITPKDRSANPDIRTLKDDKDISAADLAKKHGGPWAGLVKVLTP